ncbi:hypothetical protein ACLMJK_006522 [Lecanora helva]
MDALSLGKTIPLEKVVRSYQGPSSQLPQAVRHEIQKYKNQWMRYQPLKDGSYQEFDDTVSHGNTPDVKVKTRRAEQSTSKDDNPANTAEALGWELIDDFDEEDSVKVMEKQKTVDLKKVDGASRVTKEYNMIDVNEDMVAIEDIN